MEEISYEWDVYIISYYLSFNMINISYDYMSMYLIEYDIIETSMLGIFMLGVTTKL